jgi:hypothetical protein
MIGDLVRYDVWDETRDYRFILFGLFNRENRGKSRRSGCTFIESIFGSANPHPSFFPRNRFCSHAQSKSCLWLGRKQLSAFSRATLASESFRGDGSCTNFLWAKDAYDARHELGTDNTEAE